MLSISAALPLYLAETVRCVLGMRCAERMDGKFVCYA